MDQAKESLDIAQFAYQHGSASPPLDLVDAERNYRSAELGFGLAFGQLHDALEQLRLSEGTGNLPVKRNTLSFSPVLRAGWHNPHFMYS